MLWPFYHHHRPESFPAKKNMIFKTILNHLLLFWIYKYLVFIYYFSILVDRFLVLTSDNGITVFGWMPIMAESTICQNVNISRMKTDIQQAVLLLMWLCWNKSQVLLSKEDFPRNELPALPKVPETQRSGMPLNAEALCPVEVFNGSNEERLFYSFTYLPPYWKTTWADQRKLN